MRPINPRILSHHIDYVPYEPDDTYQSDNWGVVERVRKVRVEPRTKLVRTSNGESVESNTRIFVDAVFSSKLDFADKGKIIFEGREMIIKAIDSFYSANGRLHHLEIYCA